MVLGSDEGWCWCLGLLLVAQAQTFMWCVAEALVPGVSGPVNHTHHVGVQPPPNIAQALTNAGAQMMGSCGLKAAKFIFGLYLLPLYLPPLEPLWGYTVHVLL